MSSGLGMLRKDKVMKLLCHSNWVNLNHIDIDDAGNYIYEVENEGEPIHQTYQLTNLGKINPLLSVILS